MIIGAINQVAIDLYLQCEYRNHSKGSAMLSNDSNNTHDQPSVVIPPK